MMNHHLSDALSVLLANTYTLYLKTQNYHWHVVGPFFHSLHTLFESQYLSLASAVDELAERMRMLGFQAPATLSAFLALKTLQEGQSNLDASAMIADLIADHVLLIRDLKQLLDTVEDRPTIHLLEERMVEHDKMRWMLDAMKTS